MKNLEKEEILAALQELVIDYELDEIDTHGLGNKLSLLSKQIEDHRSTPITQKEIGNFLICTPLLGDMVRSDPQRFRYIVRPLKLLSEFTDKLYNSEDRGERLMAIAITVKYFDNRSMDTQSKIESAKLFTQRIRENDAKWNFDQNTSYGAKGSTTSFYRKYHEFEEELIDLYRNELTEPEIYAIIKVSEVYNHTSKIAKKKKNIREKLADKFIMIKEHL